MQNVGKKKITQENVLNEFKNRLIFENVLQKTKKRYELSKELNAENNDFKFINETVYNSNYFKPIPVDEMLYSILMNNNVCAFLTLSVESELSPAVRRLGGRGCFVIQHNYEFVVLYRFHPCHVPAL